MKPARIAGERRVTPKYMTEAMCEHVGRRVWERACRAPSHPFSRDLFVATINEYPDRHISAIARARLRDHAPENDQSERDNELRAAVSRVAFEREAHRA